MAGYDIVWANELDREVSQVYRENIGKEIVCEDITKIDVKDIPSCDVLIGGPPCQAFSMIGKRDNTDKNFHMIWEFLKVLEKKKPKKFLIENVTGLRSVKDQKGKKVLDILFKKISNLGYTVNYTVLNAADFGVPQRRKRLIIVGNLGKHPIQFPEPTHAENPNGDGKKKWVTVRDAIGDLPKPLDKNGILSYTRRTTSEYQKWLRHNSKKIQNHKIPNTSELDRMIIQHVTEGGNYMDVPDSIPSNRIRKYKITGGRTTTYGRLHRDMPSYTINTYFSRLNVGCNIHYSQNRLITIREGLRLQSFKDNFKIPEDFSKRSQYKLVGNAVPPLLAYQIALAMKK